MDLHYYYNLYLKYYHILNLWYLKYYTHTHKYYDLIQLQELKICFSKQFKCKFHEREMIPVLFEQGFTRI